MYENPHVQVERLPCGTPLYRAIPYDSLLRKDGSPRDSVFFRREASDLNGLSVTTTVEACKAQFHFPIFGVLSVLVGAFYDLGLEAYPSSDTHVNIRHIPTRTENEPVARDIASDLILLSRPVENWQAENVDELIAAVRAARANPN